MRAVDFTSRIIPARAGFTCRRSSRSAGSRDHPRSRGVYPSTHTGPGPADGSSPLARGLPGDVARVIYDRRIIPARAGFTPRATPLCRFHGDHPRSRGVYVRRAGTHPVRERIIPARAGFTWRAAAGGVARGDHPRSRGVYPTARSGSRPDAGSSPLARGLLTNFICSVTSGWIIPARAGFTTSATAPPSRRTDHPRSRGVYDSPAGQYSARAGSSPLARGLLSPTSTDEEGERIIPARAGFTPRTGPTGGATRDHPRSRGVYSWGPRPRSWASGSSPLARGLRRVGVVRVLVRGIIPARAGFTRCRLRSTWPARDHPRSRGVYASGGCEGAVRAGSSPLARGLPVPLTRAAAGIGIIPARAGFTLGV